MLAWAALKGAGWLVFSRFVGRLIDFFTLLILARLLLPEEFGLVALAMALVVVVDTVLEVPVTQALVRLASVDKTHLDTGFTLGVLRSAAIGLVLLAAIWPYSLINGNPLLAPVIAVMAVAPVVKGFISPAIVCFARDLDFRPTFLMEITSKLCAFAAAVATVFFGGAYWALVTNFVTSAVMATLISYVIAPYRPKLSLKRLPDFAGFVGWFSSAQLISALNWQFDRFLIGATGNNAMLGRYVVANDMAVVPTQSIIGPALQPVMAAFSQISADEQRMKFAFLKAARFAMLISVPTSLGIALTADLVTEILLGPQWRDAAFYLSLLALSVIPIPYFQTLYSAGLALDRPEIVFKLNAIDLGMRVPLISIGFSQFSVSGACFARILLSFVMFAFYLREAQQILGLGIWQQLQKLWKIAFSACVMTIVVIWLREELAAYGLHVMLELAVVAAIGAASYFGTLFALGIRLEAGRGRLELIDRR